MKILVIEDEEAIADALIHMLIKNKYLADACYDGESGLDNALTGIYDLIILDIMLPIFHLIFKRIRYLVIQILFTLVLKNFVLWKFS